MSGRLTADGRALVANDMHLSIRVPNTWYRASLEWPDPSNPAEPNRLTGVTLPGVPTVVVGSNTHVAWGFTNTYADWSDIVLLDVDPARPNAYLTPQGWRESDGSRGWDGWLADAEYPRIVDPPDGRIWTANARVVDGEMLAKLGDGSYEIGSRARIVRDRLAARNRFTARDLLDIQLDTSADFLSRWRDLILRTLTRHAIGDNNHRAMLGEILDTGWSGHATPDSAAYRLTRAFREVVSGRVIAFVLSECYEADRLFDYTTVRRRDAAIWKLVTEQPPHLLDPQYATWDEMLLDAVDATIEQAMGGRGGTLRDRVWSEYNVTSYRHPLSGAVPFIGRWLDMPTVALPGDLYTPRVHSGAIGASERMVVSPGREADGIMHMPTGQSGHPLSRFYANSHAAWVKGEPTPFLPGPAVHTLTLTPE